MFWKALGNSPDSCECLNTQVSNVPWGSSGVGAEGIGCRLYRP